MTGDSVETGQESPTPTFMDHYLLKFSLWAFITDAEGFLHASSNFSHVIRVAIMPPQEGVQKRTDAQLHLNLAKYHFVSAMGSLLRHIRRTHSLFPSIQSAWERAIHLQKEGKDLRDMIEHADQYIAGDGRKQDKFIREGEGIATNLPGDQPGQADATSLVIDNNGHWLGGRLNVERALSEVRAIWTEAEKIAPPQQYARPR
jgi:hypothetical protein